MNSLFAYSKSYQYVLTLLFLLPLAGISQYTDVINSNRPGVSVSAYAVGKNVVQAEMGLFYEQKDQPARHGFPFYKYRKWLSVS